ncbi:MAG TPA: HEPN domain-containing protein [Puia sp.]|nr:HEPN domain-containing protein [Puia sp.]
MIQEEIFKGEWSLPGGSESFTGTLTYDPLNGAKLEIFGKFDHRFGPISHEIILGKTKDGWVTLYDTHYSSGGSSNETGIVVSAYAPSFIFVGHQFQNLNELQFSSVSFSLFNLIEWTGFDGLSKEGEPPTHSFEYVKPKNINFKCYEGCEAKIEFDLSGRYLNAFYNIQLDQTCKVTFQYTLKKIFRDILSDIFTFLGFITLCTYEQSYPLTIFFSSNDIIDKFILDNLKKLTIKPIKCIYQNSFYNPDYKIKKLYQHLIKFESIAEQFGSIITNWFAKSKELEPVIKLLLLSFVNKYEFTTEKFMDMTRALETFHRQSFPNELIPKKEFANRLKKLCSTEQLPFEGKWLNDKLQFANEPSLKERLEELVRVYSFQYFNERVTNTATLCKQARDSRNYYTHFNKKLKNKSLKGKELFDLTENLKLLLISAVFKSIGISSDSFEQAARMLVY